MVKAALTTTAATHCRLAAAPVAYDRGTVLAGTSYRLNARVMLRGTASALFDKPQVVTYGGELGVSVSF